MTKDFLETFLKLYLVPVLVVLLFVLAIALIYNRLYYVYLSHKKRVYLPKISEKLTALTFSGIEGEALSEEIKAFKKNYPYHKPWFRKIVLTAIIDLSHNLKGELIYQVREIYMTFGLHKYSLHLIKSWAWYTKCVGISHFQALHFVHGLKYIKPYIASKNKVLRSNAFIAYLYLTTEPFDFLVDYPYSISSVNEYKVIDVFYMKKEPMPKNIHQWLEAKNESIVVLGLKVMVFYNYTGASDKIIALLNSANAKIRQEAILSIRELYLIEAEKPLQKLLQGESKVMQLEIIQSLAVIGTEETVAFITRLLADIKSDKDVKMELLRCLKQVDINYFNSRFLYDMEIDRMKEHINSPYL